MPETAEGPMSEPVDLNSRHHDQTHTDEIAAWRKSKGI